MWINIQGIQELRVQTCIGINNIEEIDNIRRNHNYIEKHRRKSVCETIRRYTYIGILRGNITEVYKNNMHFKTSFNWHYSIVMKLSWYLLQLLYIVIVWIAWIIIVWIVWIIIGWIVLYRWISNFQATVLNA